jgi:hypothetical protein
MDNENTSVSEQAEQADSSAPIVRLATMPTQAAIASGTVGNYSLHKLRKTGAYELRPVAGGKAVPERFDTQADAAWYAQRLSRLDQVRADRGKLFMPKVVMPAGYTLAGEPGAYRVLDEQGAQVGPTWTHRSNGKIDAFRWAQRIARKGAAA